jgi:hypothetical protein
MTAGIIAGLTGLGVSAVVGEKILNNLGKAEWGQFVGIVGFSNLGISAITGIVKLIQVIAKIG